MSNPEATAMEVIRVRQWVLNSRMRYEDEGLHSASLTS
jgi:hypothetical protein